MSFTITYKQTAEERKFRKLASFETDENNILALALKFKAEGSEDIPPPAKVAVFKGRKIFLSLD